jgi:hypothetical protein
MSVFLYNVCHSHVRTHIYHHPLHRTSSSSFSAPHWNFCSTLTVGPIGVVGWCAVWSSEPPLRFVYGTQLLTTQSQITVNFVFVIL